MPKTIIEVLPSPHDVSQLPVKRSDLAAEVQRQVAEILHARDEFMFEPWFRSRQIAYELKRLQTVSEQQAWTIYYNRFGCLVCQTQTRTHGGRGFCSQCYALVLSRKKQIHGEQIRDEVAQPARGRLRLDRMLPAGKASDGTHHTRYHVKTAKERELCDRVAKRLNLSKEYVYRIFCGDRRGPDVVVEALKREAEQVSEDRRGSHPNNLHALKMARADRTRTALAEQGLSPDNAAVGVTAAIEALLRLMPHTEAEAMTQSELFDKAVIPTKSTGRKALRHLWETGQIQRTGKGLSAAHFGVKGNPYRYFTAAKT